VVQFEQSEFISRDPIAESDKEVKGTATNLSRNASSVALSALGAIGSKDSALRAKQSRVSPSSSIASTKHPSTPPVATTSTVASLFGRLSAHNPVWKHEVSLCVFTLHVSPSLLESITTTATSHLSSPPLPSPSTTVQSKSMAFLEQCRSSLFSYTITP
jgi:hypothetical protein